MIDSRAEPQAPDLTRLLQAVETSGEIIFMTDREGVFTFVNAQFERLYGHTAAEVVGRATPRLLKGGAVSPEQYAGFWQRLSQGETVEDEFVNRKKDGGLLRIHATVSPIRDDHDVIVGFLAIQRDTTAQKAAEEHIRAQAARLEILAEASLAFGEAGEDYQALIDRVVHRVAEALGDGCYIRLLSDDGEWLNVAGLHMADPAALEIGLAMVTQSPERADQFSIAMRVVRTGEPALMPVNRPEQRRESSPAEVWPPSERFAPHSWIVVPLAVQGRAFGVLVLIRHQRERPPFNDDDVRLAQDLASRAALAIHSARLFQALSRSQSALQLISDNVLDLVGQVDLDATFVYVSPSFEAILGHAPSHLIGTCALALVHPDDLERVQARLAETISHGTKDRAEFRCRHADGRYLWIEGAGKVLLDDHRRARGVVLSGRDITERRRSEESLRENDERFGVAVASAGMSVFTQDRDLRFTWMHNPQLGMTVEQMIGKTDDEVLPPELAKQIVPNKRRALETGERVRAEISSGAGSQKRVFELLVEPQRNPAGEIDGIHGALMEITKRRELEDQLRQSQKLEAVGSLAGGIAHDFNNLLTVILGYAEMAASELDPASPMRADIEEIQRAGRSAESLTRQLLIFSRKGIVQPVLLHFNDVVARMEKILRRVVGEDIEFRVWPGPELGSVKADAGQLDQVLMNLVVNARDAMPSGGVLTIETDSIHLDDSFARAHGGSAGGAFDRLTVTDTGCGMTPEVQTNIFNPFFTTKGPEKGTGLGLATVHGIAQQAGGFITVKSAPGQGSTFTLHLPRAANQADTVSTSIPTAIPTGVETVLFVEDDDGIRALGVRALGQRGYAMLPARHAAEALAIAATHDRIHLLVTDLVMPGLNGRLLAERLRQSHPVLKVLYSSGYTSDSATLREIRTSGLDFLQKPYALETLIRAVRGVLDRA